MERFLRALERCHGEVHRRFGELPGFGNLSELNALKGALNQVERSVDLIVLEKDLEYRWLAGDGDHGDLQILVAELKDAADRVAMDYHRHWPTVLAHTYRVHDLLVDGRVPR